MSREETYLLVAGNAVAQTGLREMKVYATRKAIAIK